MELGVQKCLWNWEWGTNCNRAEWANKSYWFLFKKRSFFTVLGFSQFLFFDTISPALANTLSHGTEDAGVHKYVSACWYKWGYWCFCLLQYKILMSIQVNFSQVTVYFNCCIRCCTWALSALSHRGIQQVPKVTYKSKRGKKTINDWLLHNITTFN